MSGTKLFKDVFSAELAAIAPRHKRQTGTDIATGSAPTVALGLTGLCCSGGGIRSAAFCLGVLQGLQSKNVLERVDYLSTVSGGGYIGSTLSIAMAKGPDADAAGTTSPDKEAMFPFGRLDEDRESPEVKHLRDNSRYLLQNGIIGLVPAAAIYLRGLAMNAIAVLPLLLLAAAAIILLNPTTQDLVSHRFAGFDFAPLLGNSPAPVTELGALLVAALLVLYAALVSSCVSGRSGIGRSAPRSRPSFWASCSCSRCSNCTRSCSGLRSSRTRKSRRRPRLPIMPPASPCSNSSTRTRSIS